MYHRDGVKGRREKSDEKRLTNHTREEISANTQEIKSTLSLSLSLTSLPRFENRENACKQGIRQY